MRPVTILFMFLFSLTVEAQPQWTWATSTGRAHSASYKLIRTNNAGDVFTSATFDDTVVIVDTFLVTPTCCPGNYLARLDPQGNRIWAQFIGGNSTYILDLCIDNQNNSYIIGRSNGQLIFADTTINSFGSDYFIASFDASGVRRWILSSDSLRGLHIVNDNSGSLLILERWNDQLRVHRYSYNGSLMGIVQHRSSPSFYPYISKMRVDPSGSIYLGGSVNGVLEFDSTIYYQTSSNKSIGFILKLDPSGTIQRVKALPGAQVVDFDLDATGNIYISGKYDTTMQAGQFTLSVGPPYCQYPYDCHENFLAKLDPNDSCLWARSISPLIYLNPYGSVAVSQSGDLYFSATTVYDCDSLLLDTVLFTELYRRSTPVVFQFNSNGIAQWVRKSNGENYDNATSSDIVYSEIGCLYVTGDHSTRSSYISFGTDTLPGYFDLLERIFVTKLGSSQNNTGIQPRPDSGQRMGLSPNPTHGLFTLSGIPENSEIHIYNSLGMLVCSSTCTESLTVIDLIGQPKGIYFVEMVSEKDRSTQKIIIE